MLSLCRENRAQVQQASSDDFLQAIWLVFLLNVQ